MIEQACKCLQLADLCADKTIAGGLVDLARMFAQRAIERGAHPSRIPAKALLKPVADVGRQRSAGR